MVDSDDLMFPEDKTLFSQVFVTMLACAGVPNAQFKQFDTGLTGLS